MLWHEAEAALRAHIEARWAAGVHARVPLFFENDPSEANPETFVYISIEGVFADKGIFGSVGKRISQEGGIVFIHAFVPGSTGKGEATAMVVELTTALELQVLDGGIYLEGGEPPSPADLGGLNVPAGQPGGAYFRVSGSVPFVLIGSR